MIDKLKKCFSRTSPQRFCFDNRAIDDVETNGVRPVLVDDNHGVGVVLLLLRHLLTIRCQHQTVDYQVLEGRFVEQCG